MVGGLFREFLPSFLEEKEFLPKFAQKFLRPPNTVATISRNLCHTNLNLETLLQLMYRLLQTHVSFSFSTNLDRGTFWGFLSLSLCRSHLPPVPRCRCRYRPSFLPSFLPSCQSAASRNPYLVVTRAEEGEAGERGRGNGDSQKMSIAAHFQTRSKKVCLFMAAQIGAVLMMQRRCLGRERSGCWHACLFDRPSSVRRIRFGRFH